jgi:hypothetical protein
MHKEVDDQEKLDTLRRIAERAREHDELIPPAVVLMVLNSMPLTPEQLEAMVAYGKTLEPLARECLTREEGR